MKYQNIKKLPDPIQSDTKNSKLWKEERRNQLIGTEVMKVAIPLKYGNDGFYIVRVGYSNCFQTLEHFGFGDGVNQAAAILEPNVHTP
jgi:hypothetical protein